PRGRGDGSPQGGRFGPVAHRPGGGAQRGPGQSAGKDVEGQGCPGAAGGRLLADRARPRGQGRRPRAGEGPEGPGGPGPWDGGHGPGRDRPGGPGRGPRAPGGAEG